MNRLDRWTHFRSRLRQRNVAALSPESGDIEVTENTLRFENVATVANVARVKTKKSSALLFQRDFHAFEALPAASKLTVSDVATLATTATIENPGHEIKNINVATQRRQSGDIAVERTILLDFETRNVGGVDLATAGAWAYAAHVATQILTLSYRTPGGRLLLWKPSDLPVPLAWFIHDPDFRFSSFGDFDRAIWQHIMVERHGLPRIGLDRWINAQAVCSYFALPRSLKTVLPVIGAAVEKDDAGRRLTLALSKPDKKTGLYPELTPETLEGVARYGRSDVDGLTAVHDHVGTDLPEPERRIWELDQVINERGVGIDVEFVRAAKRITAISTGMLLKEFADLTGGLSPYQVAKTGDWLKGRGFTLENLQDETVKEALDNLSLPDNVRRVLEIRQITASTSLKKLDAMQACVGADGRARGLFQYHAATTARWAGALFQPQNLPRPTVDIPVDAIETVVAAIKTGDPGELLSWGPPTEVLASALRFALVAADGARFGVGDFSAIELSMLLALAGQHDKCALIASGADVYRDMATTIYRLDRDAYLAIAKDDLTVEQTEQRQIGKNTVLGCGYGLGPQTFRSRYLRHMGSDEAKAFAEAVVYAHYRQSWAPSVPTLWKDLERSARQAMLRPGLTVKAACGIAYTLERHNNLPVLVCQLLNGKLLHYQNARVAADFYAWSYWAYRKGQWREIEPYGGQLTEHVVSALCRELLVDAILRFEDRGFPVVMHIHDEIVVEHTEIDERIVTEIMAQPPEWAVALGVPIAVEAWVGKRYRK